MVTVILFSIGITPMVILSVVAWNMLPAGAKWILPVFGIISLCLGGISMSKPKMMKNAGWIILGLAIIASIFAVGYL